MLVPLVPEAGISVLKWKVPLAKLPWGGLILQRAPLTEMLDPNRLLGATMTVAIYFGELAFAIVLAIGFLVASTLKPFIAIALVCCGFIAWTLAEYFTHRCVLHAVASIQHRRHHARPREAIDKIFWQIWLAFAVVYMTTGEVVLAGVLVAYAWYLSVHYCAHHNPTILPTCLMKHHLDHHKFANRNYGVTTRLWDRAFGTMLR